MKIAFNPSTVAALITPPNNKDITFDLRGRNIFARGVKFCGTDTWRDIKINNVSIGSNILDLRNGSNTTLTNTNGVVTINSTWRPVVDNLTSDSTTSSLSANQGRVLKSLIDGKSNSGHTHDDRYLKLTGGTMTGNIILSRSTAIIKSLASTSHYSYIVSWSVDGETEKYGREIGLHNLGGSDSTGSIAIVPYKTDTEPWSGNVGLFIAKNALLLDGKPIALKSNIPTSLKNPYSLTLQANGTTLATYDGSVSKIVNLTYDNVGAAAKNHTHNSLEPWASYITGDSHATALKSIFDKNKTSIPRNKFISMFSSTYGNGSYYMGYFLNGYENAPYGGFFVAHYDAAYYIGISNGSFAQHRLVYSTDIPNSLKNPHALTISLNGASQGPYDGSAAKSINITPSSIGAATSEHNHDNRYLKLTGGTMQLGEGLKFHADNNYFGTNSDARIISLLDGNDKVCDGGLIIDERATLDGKEYVTELLRIRDSEFKWRGNNILHGGNYSGILDSRYYTESEVNNLLSKKLNTSDFNWTNLPGKLAGNEFNIVNAGFNNRMWFNYLPINDRSKTATITGYNFGNGAQGYASVQASGFVKTGSSSSYVLLGDGGHQTISSLSVNYAVSAGYANGIANKGLLDSQEKIDNFITANRFEYATFKTTESNNVGFASNDGMILSIPWGSTTYGAQIAFDDVHSATVKVRSKSTSWGNWYTLLHSGNYNNYAPSKTGTGASGTWRINITGSAGSVAWGNITGKPSSFTPASHNHSFTLGATTITTGETRTAINGPFAIYTDASAGKAFSIYRDSANEGVKHWVDDTMYHIEYTNDENVSSIAIRLIDTDLERATNKGADAKDVTVYLDCYRNFYPSSNNTGSIGISSSKWANMYATTFHGLLDGNASTATNADKVDGFHANDLLTALSNSNNGVSITIGGTTKSINNISVNYANSAGNANTLDGIDSTKFLRQVVVPNNTENDFNTFSNMTLTGRIDPTTGASLKNAPWSGSGPAGGYGVLTYLFNGSRYGTQMAWEYGSNRIYIRNRYYGGSGVGPIWRTSWDTLALTSDNVASATKLQTPRTIWGQSFNGTANVDNTLRIRQTTGNYCEGIRIQTADSTWATIILGATGDSGTNANAWSIHRKSDNNFAISRNSSDGTNGLVMTSTGMGLGTTAPTQRLDVHGNIRATGNSYATHFYESSDKTLKKNIKSILSSANIPKIREFDWKDTGEHSYGFIAQELEEQGYGCLVSEANGKKTVNYTATLALTVAKLQNLINIQNKKISNLTKELKALKYGRKKNS